MRTLLKLALAAVLLLATPAAAETRKLTTDWRFHAGDMVGGEAVALDASAWKRVIVPHDFSIQDKPDGSPPFSADTVSGQDSGYLPGGIGWYRRDIVLTAAEAARVVRINFEAVYMDAAIWLNGVEIGRHHYGYTAFTLDLTGRVRAGRNVVAVRVNHPDPSSRWYAGSGIIRPVTLEVLERVHIRPGSVAVTTPVVTQASGTVHVSLQLENRNTAPARVEVRSRVRSPNGQVFAASTKSVTVSGEAAFSDDLTGTLPWLWSPETPHLSTLEQEVYVAGRLVDARITRFGFRTITTDASNGLRINGRTVLLKGGNIHHDNYMLGAAGFPDADRRKVALMKAAGYNAIRSAHNPASQATLDAADELGMLVIDEAFDAWNGAKRPMDYARFFKEDSDADIDAMVTSGRNHPSVILWSIGNEIGEQASPAGHEIARRLVARIKALDPTRGVTQAVHSDTPRTAPLFAALDVGGYNYLLKAFEPDHVAYPERVMYTAESTSKEAFAYWRAAETKPYVIGDFVWTAVDYLGEASIGWTGFTKDWKKLGPYPWHLAYTGEIDATGRKRPAAYYRQVLWKSGIDPIAAFVAAPTPELPDRELYAGNRAEKDWTFDDIHPSWTWPGQEGKPLEVVVYSEFAEVELFLNGQSLGRKPVGVETEYKARYTVPYAPGTLRAVGYRAGVAAGSWELRTHGKPAAILASVDDRDVGVTGEGLAYLTLQLVDAAGVPIYTRADDLPVTVRVGGGPAILAGLGNGDPVDAASLQGPTRKTFHGRVVAVIRSGASEGLSGVEISAPGLATVTTGVTANDWAAAAERSAERARLRGETF